MRTDHERCDDPAEDGDVDHHDQGAQSEDTPATWRRRRGRRGTDWPAGHGLRVRVAQFRPAPTSSDQRSADEHDDAEHHRQTDPRSEDDTHPWHVQQLSTDQVVGRRMAEVDRGVVVAAQVESVLVATDDPVEDDGTRPVVAVRHHVADVVVPGAPDHDQIPGMVARQHAGAVGHHRRDQSRHQRDDDPSGTDEHDRTEEAPNEAGRSTHAVVPAVRLITARR